MTLELLLSTMNLNLSDLDKMNITTPCIVINQCNKIGYREYKNFRIYDTDDIGVGKSRNMAISKSKADILLFCDNDCVYNDSYYDTIINFYKLHPKADMIFFNMNTHDNSIRNGDKFKKIHWYNYQKYGMVRITCKRKSIINNNIIINEKFGGNSKYSHGEDTIFIHDFLSHKLNLYSSSQSIGIINQNCSTWFEGYNHKFFFDKGALFKTISPKYCNLQCFQYIVRHKKIVKKVGVINALKLMNRGIDAYNKGLTYGDVYGK